MRIVIFTDANGQATARLVRATLRLASGEGAPYRVVGFVTTRPDDFRCGVRRRTRTLARRTVVAAANNEVPWRSVPEFELDLFRLGRRRGIPVLVPPSGDPGDPVFVRDLASRLRPDVALSYECRHRFPRSMRSRFAHTVNYHDGLAPDYRGVRATSFSIFAGESRSGFTFHHMTGRIDGGPILLQDSVAIDEHSRLESVIRRKSMLAAKSLPRLLRLVASGEAGRPQDRKGSYYSAHEWMALVHLARPDYATRHEILRRIRAFGTVFLTIGGEFHPATRLRSCRPGARLAFRTADDHLLRPDRFRGLPAIFYRRA